MSVTPLIQLFIFFAAKKRPALAESAEYLLRGLLYGGMVLFFINLFLGEIAEEIVAKNACDLTAINRHEDSANLALYAYLSAILLDALQWWKKILPLAYLKFAVLALATGLLAYTSHQGAELVYEKGVGVKDYVCPKAP